MRLSSVVQAPATDTSAVDEAMDQRLKQVSFSDRTGVTHTAVDGTEREGDIVVVVRVVDLLCVHRSAGPDKPLQHRTDSFFLCVLPLPLLSVRLMTADRERRDDGCGHDTATPRHSGQLPAICVFASPPIRFRPSCTTTASLAHLRRAAVSMMQMRYCSGSPPLYSSMRPCSR